MDAADCDRHVDTDKDHEMIDYIFRKILTSLSMAAATGLHHNVSRSMNFFPGKFSRGYPIYSEGDQGLFDGGMINNNIGINDNDTGTNDNRNADAITSSFGPMMMANMKRALPVPYWPIADEEPDVSPSKRLHGLNMSSSLMEEAPPPLMQQQNSVLGDGL